MKVFFATVMSCAALAPANATVVVSEIDLLGDKVELVNIGSGNVDLTGYFLCNLFRSTVGAYLALTTTMIDLSNSSDGNLLLAPGDVMTLQLASGFVTDAEGEFGLYFNGSSFGNDANMADYVAWGANASRDNVAAAKGIWGNGTFVNVAGLTAGQTVQLKFGQPGNAVGDYHIQSSTIGVAQSLVPEPSSVALGFLGGAALLSRRSRRRG